MTIIIKTLDNANITVDNKAIVDNIKIFKSLLEDYDLDDTIEVPLDITEELLNKILEVFYYEENCKNQSITDQDKYNWYNNYFSISDDMMCKLLETADYLEYEYLVDIGCEKVADSIRSCKSLNDLKKNLGLTKEISEEEKELINMNKKILYYNIMDFSDPNLSETYQKQKLVYLLYQVLYTIINSKTETSYFRIFK